MTTSRRDFLRTGVAAGALSLTSLPSWIFQSRDALGGPQTMGYEYIDKHDWKREAQQAGEEVVMKLSAKAISGTSRKAKFSIR